MGRTHRPAAAPGDKLEVGGQLDVRAQQGEQAQEEIHDLQGQEGQQVLLPVLKGRPGMVRGPLQPDGSTGPLAHSSLPSRGTRCSPESPAGLG